MKFFVISIVLMIITLVIYLPYIKNEKQCFDTSTADITALRFASVSRGLDNERICTERTEVLLTLEECIQKATGSGIVARYSNSFIERIVTFIRPVSKGLGALKADHNIECSSYYKYQLE